MARVSMGRLVLYVLVGLGLVAAIYRFAFGLGAATNLSDSFPWGLWIAFDVMTGVPLAAGGFTIALAVYILNLERYRPLVRPAVLTAFIGYILAATAILFDLGHPERIWHPIVNWNIHSPLFEVAMCVMTYLVVLALEFAPVFFEGIRAQRAAHVLRGWIIPLVILGIVLSTMHQSSLGALQLIAADRLHPLWWTQNLPYQFLVSAVATGLAMVCVEAYLSARAYGRGFETPLLASLAKGTWWVLAIYAVFRFVDMGLSGALGYIFEGSLESNMFLVEIGVGLVLPLLLLAFPAIRGNPHQLVWVQGLVLAGTVLNRLNYALIGMAKALGGTYFPSLIEFAVTIGFVSSGVLLYSLAVQYLPVFESSHAPVAARRQAERTPAHAD